MLLGLGLEACDAVDDEDLGRVVQGRGGGEARAVGRRGVVAEEGFEGKVLLGEQLGEVQRGVSVVFMEGVAWDGG